MKTASADPGTKAVNLAPGSQVARIRKLLSENLLVDAERLARTLAADRRADYRVWALLSESQIRQGNTRSAINTLSQGLFHNIDNVRLLIHLGRAQWMAGRTIEFRKTADRLATLAPATAEDWDSVGVLLDAAERHTSALRCFKRAVEAAPGNAHYLFNLATCERQIGDIGLAVSHCDRALECEPKHAAAYYLRSDLTSATAEDTRIGNMEEILKSGDISWQDERYLRFALAKEYEDLGEYVQSFAHRKAGNKLQRQHTVYDVQVDIAAMRSIVASHTSRAIANASAGYNTDSPIFVMGLPRTGTTLVDRILSSHSQVESAGERKEWAISVMQCLAPENGTAAAGRDSLIRRSLSGDMKALGQEYVKRVRALGTSGRYFIDKMPMNVLYCGLVRAALPGAKMILLERDPMDACYAIYKSLFVGAYPFSYDLEELGQYYIAYRELSKHWKNELGNSILFVKYEELVSNFAIEARRLVDFCGLPWEQDCLSFHTNPAKVTTASAVQVRLRPYTSSIGKWRHYGTELQPIADMLSHSDVSGLLCTNSAGRPSYVRY